MMSRAVMWKVIKMHTEILVIKLQIHHSFDQASNKSFNRKDCIFMHYVSSKERLFNTDNALTFYTRCQEETGEVIKQGLVIK
jgi:hypothetical protein